MTTALLVPAVVALAMPLLVKPPGWKRPAVFAAALVGVILLAAGAAGAPFTHALRLCALGLSLSLLAAAIALLFRRPGLGQLVVALTFAFLIGLVFLLGPAIEDAIEADHPARVDPLLRVTLAASPYAAAAAAVEHDFLRDPFFYTLQKYPPADYRHTYAPWHRGPTIFTAAALLLLGIWKLRRGAG